jgi:hypothetical protein
MFPESKTPLVDVAVWATLSLLTHVTVLLTPITTTICCGEYPGDVVSLPEFGSILTCIWFVAAVVEVETVMFIVLDPVNVGNWGRG